MISTFQCVFLPILKAHFKVQMHFLSTSDSFCISSLSPIESFLVPQKIIFNLNGPHKKLWALLYRGTYYYPKSFLHPKKWLVQWDFTIFRQHFQDKPVQVHENNIVNTRQCIVSWNLKGFYISHLPECVCLHWSCGFYHWSCLQF